MDINQVSTKYISDQLLVKYKVQRNVIYTNM